MIWHCFVAVVTVAFEAAVRIDARPTTAAGQHHGGAFIDIGTCAIGVQRVSAVTGTFIATLCIGAAAIGFLFTRVCRCIAFVDICATSCQQAQGVVGAVSTHAPFFIGVARPVVGALAGVATVIVLGTIGAEAILEIATNAVVFTAHTGTLVSRVATGGVCGVRVEGTFQR